MKVTKQCSTSYITVSGHHNYQPRPLHEDLHPLIIVYLHIHPLLGNMRIIVVFVPVIQK